MTQQIIVEQTGVLLGGMSLQLVDLWVFTGVLITGLLGGLWSAVSAYRSDLANNLQPTS